MTSRTPTSDAPLPGTFNSRDGRYTVRDDSLPHQIRLAFTKNAHGGQVTNSIDVHCICSPSVTLVAIDPTDQVSKTMMWEAYAKHCREAGA